MYLKKILIIFKITNFLYRNFKYEVQHGLKIHETPGVGF